MSAEETLLLYLFDSYWFEHSLIFSSSKPLPSTLLDHQRPSTLNRIRSTGLMRKSASDQFLSSKADDMSFSSSSSNPSSLSPNSVLSDDIRKLQTILSAGKEVDTFQEQYSAPPPRKQHQKLAKKPHLDRPDKARKSTSWSRKNSSKSLSELEFEELKGFMDLGFVFSDQDRDDRDSRLVSIIPGLQRVLGRKDSNKSLMSSVSRPYLSVSRPYLSEAWDSSEDDDQKRSAMKNQALLNWRLPQSGNEMELKDHLRFWAHTVASTVR